MCSAETRQRWIIVLPLVWMKSSLSEWVLQVQTRSVQMSVRSSSCPLSVHFNDFSTLEEGHSRGRVSARLTAPTIWHSQRSQAGLKPVTFPEWGLRLSPLTTRTQRCCWPYSWPRPKLQTWAQKAPFLDALLLPGALIKKHRGRVGVSDTCL